MRFIISVFVCALLWETAISQNCIDLDKVNGYRGVMFRKPLPEKIMKYCTQNAFNEDTSYMLLKEDVKGLPSYNTQFLKLFYLGDYFESIHFDMFQGKVFEISLVRSLDRFDSLSITEKKTPISYSNIIKELKSIFGEYSKQEDKETTFTNAYETTWVCSKTQIVFTFTYAGAFQSYHISITDVELDKKKKVHKFIN